MEIEQILEKTGLTQKEALVYKAILELGRASVMDIAEKAGVKRPTAYLILDELRKKELVLVIPKPKKTVYIAESPEKLRSIINEKKEALDNALPLLLASYNLKPEKPNIRYYEGREQILGIYNEILKSKEVWFFGSIQHIFQTFPDYFKKFNKEAEKKKIKIREITGSRKNDIDYAKEYGDTSLHEIRILPANGRFSFKTDHAIWDNKLAIFSYQLMFGVVIESKDVVESYKALFDLAWEGAEKI